MENDKPSFYAIIPASVRYHNELTPNAKLIYGEITALCNKKGHCWASNKYFAELYEVSRVSISKWINQLIELGFLVSKTIKKENGDFQRYLVICDGNISLTPLKENFNPPLKKTLSPLKENFNLNNTINNKIEEKIIGNVPAEQLPNEIETHPSKDLKKQTLQRKAKKVLTRLNELSSKPRGFRLVETNFKHIIARLDEGFSVMDCFHVLETKIHDPYFKENPGFYNPETLFRPKNFEKYLNQDIKEFKKQNKGPSNGSGVSGIKYNKGTTIKVDWVEGIGD